MAVVKALIYNLIWEPFLVSRQAQSSEWISQTQLTGIIQMFHIQWNFFYCGNWIDFLNVNTLEPSSDLAERGERREEIMMLLLSNCRLSIVRLTPPLPDRLRKHNVNMKLVINALISTPSLCDSQCENNLARGSKHYIPPSLPPCLTSPDGVGWNLRAGNRDWAQAEGVGEGQVVSLALK